MVNGKNSLTMSKAHLLLSIAAAVCVSCMLSCTKDRTGEEVRFQGRSFPGMPWTRIAYSGDTYKDPQSGTIYERINWEKNDPVRIMLKRDGEDPEDNGRVYTIQEVSFSDTRFSTATLNPNQEGYPWKGSGVHNFWAAYPERAALSYESGATPAYKVDWSIAGSQNQKYKETVPMDEDNRILSYLPDMTPGGTQALLVGGVQASPSDHPNVRLDFYPAMNTFDFTVGTYGEITITDFKMETTTATSATPPLIPNAETETVALTGSYTAVMKTPLPITRIDDGNNTYSRPFTVAPVSGTSGQAIEAHFDPAVTLDATTWLNFKVFAMPTEGHNITGVTINFRLADNDNDDSNDPVKFLKLKRSENGTSQWIKFPPYVKANITGLLIPGAKWKITFDGPLVEEWVEAPPVMEIAVE